MTNLIVLVFYANAQNPLTEKKFRCLFDDYGWIRLCFHISGDDDADQHEHERGDTGRRQKAAAVAVLGPEQAAKEPGQHFFV